MEIWFELGRDQPRNSPFKDHFSGHADDYARFRPTYPDELFDWLADESPTRRLAWDVACGSGQAALALAGRFERVVASDASRGQVASARSHPRVTYLVARAEASGLASGVAGLVTVAQAAHWFDLPAFAVEASRVARRGGLVAVWCYELASVSPEIDEAVRRFYDGRLGPWWPPERRLIENGYHDLHFPFRELNPPRFTMRERWTLDEFTGYLGTWSAYRRYIEEKDDPLPALRAELDPLWGSGGREVVWPLHLRAGIVD